jgi:hypothetical protein
MPTSPTTTGPEGADRGAALTAFYRAQHRRIERAVAASTAGITQPVLEDACAFAWLQLVRRADIALDARGTAWLARVATREAWRLAAIGPEQPAGAFLPEADHERELPEPAGPAGDPLERALDAEHHHGRLARFGSLKPRERRELLLHAAGYRYREIGALSRGVYVNVAVRVGADVDDMSPTDAVGGLRPGDSVADARGALALASKRQLGCVRFGSQPVPLIVCCDTATGPGSAGAPWIGSARLGVALGWSVE